VIEILLRMGADLTISRQRMAGGEPVADIRVRGARLKGIEVPREFVPLAIDEFPALFIAAANAEGTTVVTGAEELRVKESDRIQVMAEGLQALGIDAEPREDGMRITGGPYDGGQVTSHGDHRVAMAFAMAGLRAREAIAISDCDNVATSFPGFDVLAGAAGLKLRAG
jgi:5-enolpyruvylshikimate-3-phosphate synthase